MHGREQCREKLRKKLFELSSSAQILLPFFYLKPPLTDINEYKRIESYIFKQVEAV